MDTNGPPPAPEPQQGFREKSHGDRLIKREGVGPSRETLFQARIKDLQLHLKGTPLEGMIHQLYREMEAKGIALRPSCYLSDEWGCPSGVPVIGIPFYLADPALHSIEQEFAGSLETEEECMMYLRHEAGHAFNYAFKLYESEEWRKVFGDFQQPYREDYKAKPFSRKFVNHISGWYAQKHPDEDFAETFAVWLTPDSQWQKRYASWGALKKLQYVDRVAKELGHTAPSVTLAEPDVGVEEMEETVLAHYKQRELAEKVELQLTEQFDAELLELFEAPGKTPAKAETLIRAERQGLIVSVSAYSGVSVPVVRALVDHLVSRTSALGLTVEIDKAREYLTYLTALVTTLAMNYLYTNRFYEE